MQKLDAQTGSKPQGGASFEGITFSIINDGDNDVTVDGVSYAKGQVVKTITTDSKGFASTTGDCLPFGKYIIRETSSNGGYLVTAPDIHATVSEDGKIYSFTAKDEIDPAILKDPWVDRVGQALDLLRSEEIGPLHGKFALLIRGVVIREDLGVVDLRVPVRYIFDSFLAGVLPAIFVNAPSVVLVVPASSMSMLLSSDLPFWLFYSTVRTESAHHPPNRSRAHAPDFTTPMMSRIGRPKGAMNGRMLTVPSMTMSPTWM